MSIILVLAASQNGVIGKDNKLLWSLPNDLKHFKALTLGGNVVMGRKTWDSIPEKFRPLPGRRNIVLSNDIEFRPRDAIATRDLKSLVQSAKHPPTPDNFYIIGGGTIYQQFLPFADRIELTLVHETFEGDAFFTDFLKSSWSIGWQVTNRREFVADEKHAYSYSFITYERIRDGIT